MLSSTLAKYDLLDLVLGQNWPENTQRDFAMKFMTALSSSLGDLLERGLNKEDLESYEKLIARPGTTQEQISAFLQGKNPALVIQIQEKTLDLKREFLLKFYNEMVNRTQDEEKKKWEAVAELAKQDNWDEVMTQLKTLRNI